MRTLTERFEVRLVTRTTVPNGRLRWAAVIAFISNASPFAVVLPWWLLPYQDAMPSWVKVGRSPGVDTVAGGRGCWLAQAASSALANTTVTIERNRIILPPLQRSALHSRII